MEKCTAKHALAAAVAAALLAAWGCDGEENARLIVRNELGDDIAVLSLSGAGTTGNLLDGEVIEDGDGEFDVPIPVEPGTYRWHAVTASALGLEYDGDSDIELYPGPNHVVLAH